MTVPVAIEKVFAEVLSSQFQEVFCGGDYADLSTVLEAHLFPIVCVCNEAPEPDRQGVKCWNASVDIEINSSRDTSLSVADVYAEGVFAALNDSEDQIVSKAEEVGFQFGRIRQAGQFMRTIQGVRVIFATYTLVVALQKRI